MAQVAFDEARGRVVLFGGYVNGVRALDDTWTYDGVSWSPVAGPGPSARAMGAMAFDRARGRVVLNGGAATAGAIGFVPLGDTWEWDGASWSQVNVSGPGARGGAGFAWDSARRCLVLFGGVPVYYPVPDDVGDTWCYDGAWRLLYPNGGPSPRDDVMLAEDPVRGGLVLFGGAVKTGGPLSDTWRLGTGGWQPLAAGVAPSARYLAGMVTDAARAQILLFGGDGYADTQTWALR
jgi:hypothetical protein